MNLDQLNSVPAHPTIQTAYASLSAAQDSPAPMQAMGIALLFHEMCEVVGLDKGEMLDKARRCARVAQDHFSIELQALREYIHKELKQ